MALTDDKPTSHERDILELLVRVGANPMPRERIAKELNFDKTSGQLQLTLLSLSGRGWLRPEEGPARYIDWKLTDEGRAELRRRSAST